jgi:hypothetical protein
MKRSYQHVSRFVPDYTVSYISSLLFFMSKYTRMIQWNDFPFGATSICLSFVPLHVFSPFLAQILLLFFKTYYSLFCFLTFTFRHSPSFTSEVPPLQPLFSKERRKGNRLGKCCAVNFQAAFPPSNFIIQLSRWFFRPCCLFFFPHTYVEAPHNDFFSNPSPTPLALANTYINREVGGIEV